jgi:hypothetical protein
MTRPLYRPAPRRGPARPGLRIPPMRPKSRGERLARASASPTRSDPEGSSRNEPRLGRCPASHLNRANPPPGGHPVRQTGGISHLPQIDCRRPMASGGIFRQKNLAAPKSPAASESLLCIERAAASLASPAATGVPLRLTAASISLPQPSAISQRCGPVRRSDGVCAPSPAIPVGTADFAFHVRKRRDTAAWHSAARGQCASAMALAKQAPPQDS